MQRLLSWHTGTEAASGGGVRGAGYGVGRLKRTLLEKWPRGCSRK